MIALTSISPSHHHPGIQKACTNSWIAAGFEVFSFNTPAECAELHEKYPKVKFIPTHRTMEHKWGKPYPQVNALIDFAKEHHDDNVMLINSDIFIDDKDDCITSGFHFAKEGIGYAHRVDVDSLDSRTGQPYIWGLDVFFLKKKHLHLFPQTLFCIGQTFWDFWLPYTVRKAGLEVHEIKTPFAFHLKHPQRWSDASWHSMAEYARWQEDLPGVIRLSGLQQKKNTNIVSSRMYHEIKKK